MDMWYTTNKYGVWITGRQDVSLIACLPGFVRSHYRSNWNTYTSPVYCTLSTKKSRQVACRTEIIQTKSETEHAKMANIF